MALDFAVTSSTQAGIVREAAKHSLAAAAAYSTTKRNFRNTASLCQSVGVEFQPLVAETTGAWSEEALQCFSRLAKARSCWSLRTKAELKQELLQQLSVAVRSANSAAALRRLEAL